MHGCTHVQTYAREGVCLQVHAPRCTCCNCICLNTAKCKCMQRDNHAANTGMPACTQIRACGCMHLQMHACAVNSCVEMSVPASACTCKHMLMAACMAACMWIFIYKNVCACKQMNIMQMHAWLYTYRDAWTLIHTPAGACNQMHVMYAGGTCI